MEISSALNPTTKLPYNKLVKTKQQQQQQQHSVQHDPNEATWKEHLETLSKQSVMEDAANKEKKTVYKKHNHQELVR